MEMAGGAFKYRPFTFDRSFDEAEIERARQQVQEEQATREEEERLAELERNPPPPTFSEEELEAARATAFQEGSQQGIQEAISGIEAQALGALQTITGQLAVLHDRQSLSNETNSIQLAKLTSEIIERLLPHYVQRHGTDEIVALVKECLEPLEDQGRVMIRVPDGLKDILAEKLQEAARESGFEGRLVLTVDPALGPSDVRVDWGKGGTERKMEEVWQAIDEAITHCLSHMDGMNQAEYGEEGPPQFFEEPESAIADMPEMDAPAPESALTDPALLEQEMPEAASGETAPLETTTGETTTGETTTGETTTGETEMPGDDQSLSSPEDAALTAGQGLPEETAPAETAEDTIGEADLDEMTTEPVEEPPVSGQE